MPSMFSSPPKPKAPSRAVLMAQEAERRAKTTPIEDAGAAERKRKGKPTTGRGSTLLAGAEEDSKLGAG